MRVLLTTDTVGGVWDYSCTLARALDEDGHDVLVAVLGELGRRRRHLPPGVEVAARPYSLEWMPGSDADVAASTMWLERLARLWNPDVVHLNQFSAALGSYDAPTLVVAHSDVLSWFGETLSRPAPAEWRRYAERVRAALHNATIVAAPTEYQSRLLRRHYGRAADRVVHNGVLPPRLPASTPSEALVVCAARAWDLAKGVTTLDAAAARLRTSGPAVHLLGSTVGPDGQCFDARHLRCHQSVDREVVDSWMTRAAVYVAPSLYEPFGLAPLEAALHGCALVLSDIDSFRELWDGCAEFFPAGDSESLARLLAELTHDVGRVSRRAKGARRRALRRFTADHMCGQYLSLYADLAGGRCETIADPVRQTA